MRAGPAYRDVSAAQTTAQTHRVVVGLCDQGIAYLTAHAIVTSAVRTVDPTDLISDVVTVAAARGIALDVESLRNLATLTPLDLDDVRDHIQTL